ncbi:ADP-ribose glycohydrolase MACROD1 isoform X1 [Lepisosteus oculatus]|uniref:ADP-ribose glycohydrolase MACROD1 isoform X1 n=2 Tax=Lepisosteus oculatus TaxID=7918 RepID=UPI0035F50A26
MAFQISSLAARIKLPTLSLSVPSRSRIWSWGLGSELKRGSGFAGIRAEPSRRQTAGRLPALGRQDSQAGRTRTGGAWLVCRVSARFGAALGAAGLASLHTGRVCAMAARGGGTIDLDSPDGDWERVKELLGSLSQEERRKLYRTPDFLSLEEIRTWKATGQPKGEVHFKSNESLNPKISLFRGDITKLEVDAVVNAANKTLLGGGGVDGAIHRGAGPLLKKECSTLGGCETGQAKLTGAYGLPCNYVIHTVGPIVQTGSVGDRERQALRNCYWSCLETARAQQLRTVAFPCISTGVYGYPPSEAADVALRTVREYLDTHGSQLERIVFCVFLKSDEDIYQEKLPLYFPEGPKVWSKL